MRALVPVAFGLLLVSCGLRESDDFLIGRRCEVMDSMPCDQGQLCLPHAVSADRLVDFRCRDRASFERIGNQEAPLAHCDESMGLVCPPDLICSADRIRLDAGLRWLVCKMKDDVFQPPLGEGN